MAHVPSSGTLYLTVVPPRSAAVTHLPASCLLWRSSVRKQSGKRTRDGTKRVVGAVSVAWLRPFAAVPVYRVTGTHRPLWRVRKAQKRQWGLPGTWATPWRRCGALFDPHGVPTRESPWHPGNYGHFFAHEHQKIATDGWERVQGLPQLHSIFLGPRRTRLHTWFCFPTFLLPTPTPD